MTPTYQPVPPTPTALPPGTPFFAIPNSYSLWQSAPYAIQSWQLLGDGRTVIQLLFVVAILIIIAFVLYRSATDFLEKRK